MPEGTPKSDRDPNGARERWPRPRRFESLEEVERARGRLPEDVRRIVFMYLDVGLSATECGRRLHFSPSVVLRRLAAYGIARRSRGGSSMRLTERELERAVFLYVRLGLSLAAAASLEGVYPNALRHRLRAAGVQLRPRGGARRTAPVPSSSA